MRGGEEDAQSPVLRNRRGRLARAILIAIVFVGTILLFGAYALEDPARDVPTPLTPMSHNP